MKINCGESWETKARRMLDWHPYFAWYPIRVGENDCRWLETIQRKRVPSWGGWDSEYRV